MRHLLPLAALLLATACDETTSGADHVAILPEEDATIPVDATTLDAARIDAPRDAPHDAPVDTGHDAAPSLADAVQRKVHADCATFARCATQALDLQYGTEAECEARDLMAWTWLTSLAGVTVTPAALDACTDVVAGESCPAWLSTKTVIAACDLRGARANGQSCLDGLQCASGFCPTVGVTCGTCAAPPGAGAACAAGGSCGPGLVCSGAGTCVAAASAGESCGTSRPCDSPLACLNGTCAGLPSMSGAACGSAGCSLQAGLVCTSRTSGTCVPILWVGVGQACGLIGGKGQLCADNGQCVESTCQAGPTRGQACDPKNGPTCEWPDQCASSRCTALPSPGTCP